MTRIELTQFWLAVVVCWVGDETFSLIGGSVQDIINRGQSCLSIPLAVRLVPKMSLVAVFPLAALLEW